jgi:hypothetical protein
VSKIYKNTILHLQGNTRHCWGNDREEALVTILGHNLWYLVIPVIVQNNINNHRSQCQYPSGRNKRNIPSLSIQCQYPSQHSKRNITYQYPYRRNKRNIPSLSIQYQYPSQHSKINIPYQYPSRRSNSDRVPFMVLVVNVNIHPDAVE